MDTSKMVFGAVCTAFGLILPVIFHFFQRCGCDIFAYAYPGSAGGVLLGEPRRIFSRVTYADIEQFVDFNAAVVSGNADYGS